MYTQKWMKVYIWRSTQIFISVWRSSVWKTQVKYDVEHTATYQRSYSTAQRCEQDVAKTFFETVHTSAVYVFQRHNEADSSITYSLTTWTRSKSWWQQHKHYYYYYFIIITIIIIIKSTTNRNSAGEPSNVTTGWLDADPPVYMLVDGQTILHTDDSSIDADTTTPRSLK